MISDVHLFFDLWWRSSGILLRPGRYRGQMGQRQLVARDIRDTMPMYCGRNIPIWTHYAIDRAPDLSRTKVDSTCPLKWTKVDKWSPLLSTFPPDLPSVAVAKRGVHPIILQSHFLPNRLNIKAQHQRTIQFILLLYIHHSSTCVSLSLPLFPMLSPEQGTTR